MHSVGKSDFKGRDLAEILIEMEDEGNFATPCDNYNVVDSRQAVEQNLEEEQTPGKSTMNFLSSVCLTVLQNSKCL